jgi:hypothetical protein
MKEEHNLLLLAHKRRYDDMRGEYGELQRMFHDRPSRPDDIKHIKYLMKEIDSMKRSLAEAEVKVMHANGKDFLKQISLPLSFL